jgi:hypothetical protein
MNVLLRIGLRGSDAFPQLCSSAHAVRPPRQLPPLGRRVRARCVDCAPDGGLQTRRCGRNSRKRLSMPEYAVRGAHPCNRKSPPSASKVHHPALSCQHRQHACYILRLPNGIFRGAFGGTVSPGRGSIVWHVTQHRSTDAAACGRARACGCTSRTIHALAKRWEGL